MGTLCDRPHIHGWPSIQVGLFSGLLKVYHLHHEGIPLPHNRLEPVSPHPPSFPDSLSSAGAIETGDRPPPSDSYLCLASLVDRYLHR